MKMEHMNLNKKLTKYLLEFDKVWPFFKEQIEWKSLSLAIINKIDFKKGCFFTYLLPSANLEILYDFNEGIYPPNPRVGNFEPITHLDKELSEFIQNFLTTSSTFENRLAIVENAIAIKKDKSLEVDNTSIQFIGEDEVYYIISPKTPLDDILWAVSASGEVWHFLAILTEGLQLDSLDESRFDDICQHIRYVITVAYDREGYIFWEKE